MNYYPFHVGDYASHTAHLEPMEDLAYRRLLDLYYLRECPLPSDVAATAKLIRMRSMVEDVESVLNEFFVLTSEGWTHCRCDEEIEAMREKQQKQRDKANKRWHKPEQERGNAGGENAAMPRHDESDAAASKTDAVAMPPTPTPTPTPNSSVTNVTGGEPPLPQDIVFGLGVPLLTAASIKESNARSFLAMQSKAHGAEKVSEALQLCAAERPLEPVSWLQARLGPIKGIQKQSKHSGFALKNYREGVTDDGFLA